MKQNYFSNAMELSKKAVEHYKDMCQRYYNETQASIDNSWVYNGRNKVFPIPIKSVETKISIQPIGTVTAISNVSMKGSKVAALNFASYKNPGGMFMKGSSAQEECLCHKSNLFNVLEFFEPTYYKNNRNDLNNGLYHNRAIYSPDIIFEDKYKCDIITCAAPNIGFKYSRVTPEENRRALISRINFVLNIAAENNVDILILGAFGCGVFGQNPYQVADIFKERLKKHNFKEVIFAIPPGPNYDAFWQVFSI